MAYKTQTPEQDIESLFSKILSPLKKEADPNLVGQFCLKINQTLDGIHLAIKLILSKLHSEQEWEIQVVLYTLEACVKNCGSRFHTEIGKFRFLNELIKLVSPKYLGNRTSERIKKKVVEILFSWTQGLPNELKIREAYEMLKRQGIVQEDPILVDKLQVTVEPRTRSGIFEDPDKAKRLQKLLQSRNAADLEEANRIIKMMVKQDELKSERISSRINELEKISENVKLLDEMLHNYTRDTSNESELDTMKCIFNELNKFKPNLIKLANETDDNDEGIGEIIKTNDELIRCLNDYNRVVISGLSLAKSKHEDDTLLIINTHVDSNENTTQVNDPFKELQEIFTTPSVTSQEAKNEIILAKFNDSSTNESQFNFLNLMSHSTSFNLDSIFVPLNTIKPSSQSPKAIYDKNAIKIILHFARDSPSPHVHVFVVSVMSTNETQLTNVTLQVAVPKTMRVKLQPASSNDLPAYNPILPLAAITQIMLIHNPMQEKIRFRFKLNFMLNGVTYAENGEVNDLIVINEIL